MPLRFDQPKLLGEWEGDPTVIHQALAKMGENGDMLANGLRENRKLDIEKKAKKPSFKIDKVDGSPFSKDQQKMGALINGAMDAVNRGENPEPYTEKAQQISNTGKAQKNALDQLKLQTNELQQTYGADVIDTTPVSKEINSAYNDHDDETRGVAIGEAAKHIADPSIGMFKADTFYAKKLLDIKPVDYTYSDKNERGIMNEGTDRKVIGRLVVPDTKRPQYERKNGSLSPVLDANGQPVYEMRNASTIDDVIPMVRATFDSDKNAAQWAVNQTVRTEKDEIEKITKNWIDSEVNRPDGGMPDKQTIEAKKQIVARDLTEKKIAKQWLQLDRQGTTTISNTRSLDEPKQLQKQTKTDRDNVWDVSSMGAQGSDYNTRVGQKGEIGSFKTHGGVVVKNKNGKKPVLTLNEQTAKNESSGKYEKLVESTDATLDNVRAAYWYKDKAGNRIKDTQKDIIAHLKAMSPKQVVDGDYSSEPVAYLTANKASGTGDLALNPDELKEYNTLKSEFTKDYPSPSVTSPEEKGYDQNEIDRYDRLQELEASKIQKTKTFSVPYGQIEGQLGQLIGEKNASQEALMKSMGKKQYAEYLQGKKILEDKKKEYYNNLNKINASKNNTGLTTIQSQAIEAFQKQLGRKPTPSELEKIKQKYK